MKYYPKFNEKAVSFERDENNGNYLIKLAELPELGDMLVNNTTHKILHLCDGSNDIEKIIDILVSKYPNVKREVISNDVANVCSKFFKFGVIEWQGGNDPFVIANKKLLDNGYNVKLANEGDYPKLLAYLSQLDSKNIFYFVDCIEKEYVDIVLRSKLFFRIEDFYLLLDKEDKIQSVIGVINRGIKQNTQIARLSMITNFNDKDNCSFLLSYLCNTYKDNAAQETTVIRGIIEVKDENKTIIDLLTNNNFKCATKLEHELGCNIGVEYYDLNLDNIKEVSV